MKKYGSKDVMRMESIKDKTRGDYLDQLMYAYNMATAITEPGKAMARGYAAQKVFGQQSAVSQVFFERAYDLSGGENVIPVCSVNPWEDTLEGIEAEYEGIPIEDQPTSRRPDLLAKTSPVKYSRHWANLDELGKVNVIKGSGPKFNMYDHSYGTIEVWQTEDGKYRLIYTSHYDPIGYIGGERTFKYNGKEVDWKMVDYIDAVNIINLAPLYGKSIYIFSYD
jgi:hypothetical protein